MRNLGSIAFAVALTILSVACYAWAEQACYQVHVSRISSHEVAWYTCASICNNSIYEYIHILEFTTTHRCFSASQKELRHLARIAYVGSCGDFILNLFWIVAPSLVITWQCNQQATNESYSIDTQELHESCFWQFHWGQLVQHGFSVEISYLLGKFAGPSSPYMMPFTHIGRSHLKMQQ